MHVTVPYPDILFVFWESVGFQYLVRIRYSEGAWVEATLLKLSVR